MDNTIRPKIFQVGSKFGIRSEAVVPGAGRIDGPSYSVTVPVDVFWTGGSWSRTVFREFPSSEKAEKHVAENMGLMVKRAAKQFGVAATPDCRQSANDRA